MSLLALGLALYAWGDRVSGRAGIIALSVTLALSVVLAAFSERLDLPGNQDGAITDSVTRGAVSMFILTWLALAIPPTLLKLWRSSRKTFPKNNPWWQRPQSARVRLLGTHIAHAGILVLLVGHVLTTTLVDRTDPSNFVTLERDVPTQHQGMELLFTGVEVLSADDEGYGYRIAVSYTHLTLPTKA